MMHEHLRDRSSNTDSTQLKSINLYYSNSIHRRVSRRSTAGSVKGESSNFSKGNAAFPSLYVLHFLFALPFSFSPVPSLLFSHAHPSHYKTSLSGASIPLRPLAAGPSSPLLLHLAPLLSFPPSFSRGRNPLFPSRPFPSRPCKQGSRVSPQ